MRAPIDVSRPRSPNLPAPSERTQTAGAVSRGQDRPNATEPSPVANAMTSVPPTFGSDVMDAAPLARKGRHYVGVTAFDAVLWRPGPTTFRATILNV